MAFMSIIFFFLILLYAETAAQHDNSTKIYPGSSLSPKFKPSWVSPSGHFAFGFYQQGTGFAVGIWLVGKSNNTVVWTANRDDQPVSAEYTIVLTKYGRLCLRFGDEENLIANSSEPASVASLQDSGNLRLYNEKNEVIWESFRYPTDTILGGQTLFSGHQLISSLEINNDHATGRFHMWMKGDGNVVLYPLKSADTLEDSYWSSYTNADANGNFDLFLNTTGRLDVVNRSSLDVFRTINGISSSSESIHTSKIYRATLDSDGVFRLYSHMYDGSNGELNKTTEWEALKNPCAVKSICGFNSFCTLNDVKPECHCLDGYNFIDLDQKSLGCTRDYVEVCNDGTENAFHFSIKQIDNLIWEDGSYTIESIQTEECSMSCLKDCNCAVAILTDKGCEKQSLPLRYIRRNQAEDSRVAFLKVGIVSSHDKNTTNLKQPRVVNRSKKATVQILLLTTSLVLFSLLALVVSGLYIHKFRFLKYKRLLGNGKEGLTDELTLQLFTYNELKEATNGFREELGKGSFGSVYRGTLYKGKKLIAVKRLQKLVEEGEREFKAEMRSIGRTRHKNLVRLLGYCATDSKRLLVYEYMSNGSLADLIFKSKMRPNWNERLRIALDIARGILYLHEGCESPIIHCDIKPQNILMDDFWRAKISDFGLAKLLMPDQTRTFTIVRGTRGYVAPEWHKNIPISVKADVYSYGILLLEIVCCRRNMDIYASKPEEILLSRWVYNCFTARELNKLVIGEEDIDKKILDKMVKVALWCIQDEPTLRPSMKIVVLMLEWSADVSIPPCPT